MAVNNLQQRLAEANKKLLDAVRNQDIEAVNLQIRVGADVNPVFALIEQSPLGIAVAQQDGKIAKILLDTGANPNLRDKNGISPMHIAVNQNAEQLVEMLLAADAPKPNNKYDNTLLTIAKQNGNEKITKMLEAAIAKIDAPAMSVDDIKSVVQGHKSITFEEMIKCMPTNEVLKPGKHAKEPIIESRDLFTDFQSHVIQTSSRAGDKGVVER